MGNQAGTSMGDAISKVSTTRAEARLAEATRSVQLWDCSTHDGTRIWDAKAGCINRPLLSAVDEIIRLKKIHAFPVASPAHRCMDSALGTAMSRLMDEFLLLRIWDASQLEEMITLASAGVSLPFHFGVSTSTGSTTGEFSLSTTNTSGGSRWSRSDVFLEGKFLDQFYVICPATLPVLSEIALRVIHAGSEQELLQTFTRAPCEVLDRFLSILRRGCSTMEVLMKRWIAVTKLIGKAIAAMRRQLYAQNSGAFDGFREEYLMAITENPISILLEFADGFTCSIASYEKLVYFLEAYEALNSAAPNLLFLFSGARKELISEKILGVLTTLADSLKNMFSGLITKTEIYRSNTPSATDDVGVHPLSRYAMSCLGHLVPYSYSTALDFIPYNNGGGHGPGAPAGGAERVTRIGRLMLELIDLLERRLDKLALVCADGGGSPDLFLVNNLSFLLEYGKDADLASLLGQEWDQRLGSRLEGLVERYVEAYWAPVVACLDTSVGGSPAKVLAKFNAAFDGVNQSQVCCKVWSYTQREALRKAAKKMVVPAFMAFLQKHPKLQKSISYTCDDLDKSLSVLFEG